MKADIRPCLQQGEVGDILSDFLNTTDLTTPQAEKVDSFSPYTLQLFFSPPCALLHTHLHTYTHTSRRTHSIPDLCGVKWRAGGEVVVQSKARELSEECIQHTLDSVEVQMLGLIMQAERKRRTSQFKHFSKLRENK